MKLAVDWDINHQIKQTNKVTQSALFITSPIEHGESDCENTVINGLWNSKLVITSTNESKLHFL